MIQTQQFLQEQIDQVKKYQHKQVHQNVKKSDLVQSFKQLTRIYIKGQQMRTNQIMISEDQQDKLRLEKIMLNQSLGQCRRKLRDLEIQKDEILSSCQRNQTNMTRQINLGKTLKENLKENQIEKSLLQRKIQQNQIHIEQSKTQSQKLRLRCEEQIQLVQQTKINRKSTIISSKIEEIISKNLELIEKIQQKNQKKIAEIQKQKDSDIGDPKLKLCQLMTQLKLQNEQNKYMKGCIQAQKYVLKANLMKKQILEKLDKSKKIILSEITQETSTVQKQVQQMSIENSILKQKFQKFKKIQKELMISQLTLKNQIKSYQSQDKVCLKKMSTVSNRFEKKLDARYLLTQRRNIVDQYKKYILGNKQ